MEEEELEEDADEEDEEDEEEEDEEDEEDEEEEDEGDEEDEEDAEVEDPSSSRNCVLLDSSTGPTGFFLDFFLPALGLTWNCLNISAVSFGDFILPAHS